MIKLLPPEWKPPTKTLERFYYYEVPTRALSPKHFAYYKKEEPIWYDIDYDTYLKGLSEHDAIHYLMGFGFDEDGEERAVTVEMHCNVGWYAVNPRFNQFSKRRIKFGLPKGLGKKTILETAEKIRDLY